MEANDSPVQLRFPSFGQALATILGVTRIAIATRITTMDKKSLRIGTPFLYLQTNLLHLFLLDATSALYLKVLKKSVLGPMEEAVYQQLQAKIKFLKANKKPPF
jgi:hypothetical protein